MRNKSWRYYNGYELSRWQRKSSGNANLTIIRPRCGDITSTCSHSSSVSSISWVIGRPVYPCCCQRAVNSRYMLMQVKESNLPNGSSSSSRRDSFDKACASTVRCVTSPDSYHGRASLKAYSLIRSVSTPTFASNPFLPYTCGPSSTFYRIISHE